MNPGFGLVYATCGLASALFVFSLLRLTRECSERDDESPAPGSGIALVVSAVLFFVCCLSVYHVSELREPGTPDCPRAITIVESLP